MTRPPYRAVDHFPRPDGTFPCESRGCAHAEIFRRVVDPLTIEGEVMRNAHPEPYGLPQGLRYVPQEFADEIRRARFRARVRLGAVLGLLIGAMLGLLLLAVLAAVAQNDSPAPATSTVTPSTYGPPATH